MKIHELKCWPEYFRCVENGTKTFEARKNDRGFECGDRLLLREWKPEIKAYTGKQIKVLVTYVLLGPGYGIEEGYCVMAIQRHNL